MPNRWLRGAVRIWCGNGFLYMRYSDEYLIDVFRQRCFFFVSGYTSWVSGDLMGSEFCTT